MLLIACGSILIMNGSTSTNPYTKTEGKPRIRPGNRMGIHAVLLMQARLFQIVVDQSVNPAVAARAALSWEKLEDRKRILRGKPLPGSLKPLPKKNKRKTYDGPLGEAISPGADVSRNEKTG